MQKIIIVIFLILAISISANNHCEVTITNGSFDQPNLGDKEAVPKVIVNAVLDRVDARPVKQIWVDDPGVAAVLENSAWTELPEAIKAIGSTSANLRVSRGTFNVNGNLTIPSGITLLLERGVTLSISTGVTLTINGGFQAGLYQIFSCTGTGKVVFGAGSVKEVYPEWWGAKGDNRTDCTAAIQAAINAVTGKVFLSTGTYKTSSTILLINNGINVVGAGETATTLSSSFSAGNILSVGDASANPNNCSIQQLSITSTVPKTSGAAIYVSNGHNIRLDRLRLDANLFFGFQFEGGPDQFLYYLSNFEVNSGVNGILVGESGNLVQDLWINNGIISNTTNSGILLRHVSGFYFDAIDILACKTGLTTYPETDKVVVAGLCSKIICDTSKENGFNIIANGGIVGDCTFNNCWTSSNGQTLQGKNAENGVFIGTRTGAINGITFSTLRSNNNKGAGIYVLSGDKLSFADSHVFCNSTRGAAVRSGIEIAANITGFSIIGNICGKGGIYAGNNYQAYGILVNIGSGDGYIIMGNNLYDNGTGGLSDGGTGAAKIVRDNLGYASRNGGVSFIASGQTSVVVNHGLAATPSFTGITITPTTSWPTGAPYLDTTSLNATSFTIRCVATGADEYFTWDARSPGDK